MTSSAAKVVVADQQPALCAGLAAWLADCPDLALVATADSTATVEHALDQHQPHILITDLQLHGEITLPMFSSCLQRWPELLIMVYSMSDERLFARRCLTAGARGYLMKSSDRETLLKALRELHANHSYLSPNVKHDLIENLFINRARSNGTRSNGTRSNGTRSNGARSNGARSNGARSIQTDDLTDRQYSILGLIAEGRSRSEMAQLLGLSVKTIDAHKANIRERLGLENCQALMHYAMRFHA